MGMLDELLAANDVDRAKFEAELCDALVVGVFEIMVDRIEQKNELLRVRHYYRGATDDRRITANMLRRYVGVKLPDSALSQVDAMMQAYLAKTGSREAPSKKEVRHLLECQDFRCHICGTPINDSNAEYDHRIAFKYVGDALPDNYQMLCMQCNREKGSSAYYMLSRALCQQ